MEFDLGSILQQYLGGNASNNTPPERTVRDFEQVAPAAPRADLAHGVSEALRAEQTPPFPEMVGQLFERSAPDQRAGMLNQLISGLGPGLLASISGGTLGALFSGKPRPDPVTPQIAAQLTPQQVQEIAAAAEQHNPGIIDQMGNFYAEHPTLVKALGGVALAIVLGKMAEAGRH